MKSKDQTLLEEAYETVRKSKSIYETGFGWVSPLGATLGTESFNHLQAIAFWPPFKDNPDISDTSKKLIQSNKAQHDQAGIAGGLRWHEYEPGDESYAYDEVMRAGFIRIGTNRDEKVIEAEGSPKAILKHMQRINKIVKEFNAENQKDYTLRIHNRDVEQASAENIRSVIDLKKTGSVDMERLHFDLYKAPWDVKQDKKKAVQMILDLKSKPDWIKAIGYSEFRFKFERMGRSVSGYVAVENYNREDYDEDYAFSRASNDEDDR